MSEQTEFLKDLEIDNTKDVFNKPLAEEPKEPEKETEEDAEQKLKNRRERRLYDKLQSEREANIALNARLETIAESKHMREEEEVAEYLKRAEKIYGNATPEAKEATQLLIEALRGVEENATKKAFDRYQSERTNDSEAEKKEEKNLDDILEKVEEEHGIDMSDDKQRTGFLTLLEKLSPKDSEGNIIEYADPETTAEVYLSRQEKSNSRAKDLASRSMSQSGTSQPSKIEEDVMARWIKENISW